MLKKTITFEDFNGEQITEDFYFNLSKAEIVELQVGTEKGLAETLQEIVKANDGKLIIENFKKIILLAYGKKSEDGRRFIKSQDLRDEFEQSSAYSELFIELATNAEKAAEFINGIVPTGLAGEIQNAIKNTENAELSDEDLLKMNPKDMSEAQIRRAFMLKGQM